MSQDTLKKLEQDIEAEREKNKNLKKNIEIIKSNSEDPESRAKLLEKIDHLSENINQLEKELEEYKENEILNPEVYKKKKNEIEECKKACNRWVDNIYSLKSWFKRKFFVENSVIDKHFDIPSELDYY